MQLGTLSTPLSSILTQRASTGMGKGRLVDQCKSAEAEQALTRAIDSSPKHIESYLYLAKLYE